MNCFCSSVHLKKKKIEELNLLHIPFIFHIFFYIKQDDEQVKKP